MQQQERVERRNRRAHIAKQLHAHLDNICNRSDSVGIHHAVVTWVRLRQAWEFAAGLPVELAAVDDNAADGRAMAADEFRCGVNDDIGAVFDWTTQIRAWERIIHDKRNAVLMGDRSNRFDIDNIAPADCRLSPRKVLSFCSVIAASKLLGFEGSTKFTAYAKLRQRICEQIVSAAVQAGC